MGTFVLGYSRCSVSGSIKGRRIRNIRCCNESCRQRPAHDKTKKQNKSVMQYCTRTREAPDFVAERPCVGRAFRLDLQDTICKSNADGGGAAGCTDR